jgi:hypothetical protein
LLAANVITVPESTWPKHLQFVDACLLLQASQVLSFAFEPKQLMLCSGCLLFFPALDYYTSNAAAMVVAADGSAEAKGKLSCHCLLAGAQAALPAYLLAAIIIT